MGGLWMIERAKSHNIKQIDEDEDIEDDEELTKMLEGGEGEPVEGADAEDDKEDDEPEKEEKKEEEEDDLQIQKERNWSAVNVAAKESKLTFKGCLTPVALTNWIWYRCVRPKLEETKSKLLSEIDLSGNNFCIEDIEEIL